MEFKTKLGPFIQTNNKTKKIMINLLIALLPIIIFSYYKNGFIPYYEREITLLESFRPLLMILVGSLTSLMTESIYLLIKYKKEAFKEIATSYTFLPGLFLSLIISINTPIYLIILGAFIASLTKILFGGFGKNMFNPALTGAIVLLLFFSSMNGGYLNKYEVDTLSKATPLSNIATSDNIYSYDNLVKPYGNLGNFAIGFIPGSMAETSSILIILAFVYLTYKKVIKWKIPVFYVTTVFLMTYIIGLYNGIGIWYPLFHILSGGLLFGAVFMATDPITTPITSNGQITFGILLGILTVLIRFFLPYPEGVCISILIMNAFVPILDKIGIKAKLKPSINILVLTFVWILFTAATAYTGYVHKKVEKTANDPNFALINKVNNGNEVVYTVTQKGFMSKLKGELTFKDNKLISIKMIDKGDSYYHLIEESDLLDRLVTDADKVEDVDAVSGATISSNALKKMVINTYKKLNE